MNTTLHLTMMLDLQNLSANYQLVLGLNDDYLSNVITASTFKHMLSLQDDF